MRDGGAVWSMYGMFWALTASLMAFALGSGGAQAAPADPGYRVAVQSAVEKVFKDSEVPVQPEPTLRLFAARNASDDGQVVVVAGGQALRRIHVAASDLVEAKGHGRISSRNVQLSRVGYVKTGKPSYPVDRVGWWPDPLLPLAPFDVPAGGLQPIWVTVFVPQGTRAGDYRGQITIRPQGLPSEHVDVRLRVWDFALPTKPHMRTAFGLQVQDRINPRWEVMSDTISQFYNWVSPREHDQILERICRLLLECKVSPINPVDTYVNGERMDFADADRLLAECVRLGITGFGIGYPSPKYPSKWPTGEVLKSYLQKYGDHLKQKGWLPLAYFYSWDEPTLNEIPSGGVQESFRHIRDLTHLVRETCPGVKVLVTTPPRKELQGAVDIWVPITAQYKPEECREWTNKGDEVWWYTCNWPHKPYPNLLIDEPAIDHRIIFWQAWRYGVTGFLFWAVDNWGPNVKGSTAAEKWPNRPWDTFTFETVNGDGHLIYPGPGGHPYSSIRLECVRDGIQDYEYLWQLRDRLSKLKNAYEGGSPLTSRIEQMLERPEKLAPSLTSYTQDPSEILRCREEVGQLVELAEKALRSGHPSH